MERKDVDIKSLESVEFSAITVDRLRRIIPVPGDTIHLIFEPDSSQQTRLVPEADLVGRGLVMSIKQTKQTKPCRGVQINGELLIHRACQKRASAEVLNYILQSDPESVKRQSTTGLELPIHTLLKLDETRPALKSVQTLVEAYPEALGVPDEAGCLPLHYACWNENISVDIVKYLVSRYPEALHQRGGFCNELPLWYAVENELPIQALVLLLRPFPGAVFEWGCFQAVQDHYDKETSEKLHLAALDAQRELFLQKEVLWIDQNCEQLDELLEESHHQHRLDDSVVSIFHWTRLRKQQSREALREVSAKLDDLSER